MEKSIPVILVFILLTSFIPGPGYDKALVQTKTYLSSNKEPYAVIKMSRKGNRVNVKYFAYKESGKSVSHRFAEWSANKNIIAVSSGTYMTNCEAWRAEPVGLCIDQGRLINKNLSNKMDGLIIVYATGGMVASDLKKGNLTINDNGQQKTLDIRNPLAFLSFIDWAERNNATVFQTHLFMFNNQLQVGTNGSSEEQGRRFLAVCKSEDGLTIEHYVINLPKASTLYKGVIKAKDYLNNIEDVNSIVYLINLDTGCQDIYGVRNANGFEVDDTNFKGKTPINNAANLLVYYYE